MLYFAYGSNMDWERITQRDRTPSAQFLLRATLPGYRLAFTRRSVKQRTGTADVVLCSGGIVWGVVFDIDPADRTTLDAAEGVNSGAYRPEPLTVLAENDATRPLRVLTYVVCQKAATHQPPAAWYLNHILKGAIRWNLPAEYRAEIQRTQTS
jgi:cation transport regulator ChaC